MRMFVNTFGNYYFYEKKQLQLNCFFVEIGRHFSMIYIL